MVLKTTDGKRIKALKRFAKFWKKKFQSKKTVAWLIKGFNNHSAGYIPHPGLSPLITCMVLLLFYVAFTRNSRK